MFDFSNVLSTVPAETIFITLQTNLAIKALAVEFAL